MPRLAKRSHSYALVRTRDTPKAEQVFSDDGSGMAVYYLLRAYRIMRTLAKGRQWQNHIFE